VVVDASTDDTPARIKKVAEEEGLNLNLIHMGIPLDSLMRDTETHVYHSNVGLRCTRYRWVVIWDADVIAYTSGPNDIMQLKRFLLNLDPKIFYRVNLGFLYLDGDLFHIGPWGFRIRREVFAFTWAPVLSFITLESLRR